MEIDKTADLSVDRAYRYTLSRMWDDTLPQALYICLNPSIADASIDDATVRRCIGLTKAFKACYGGFTIANLFAFRATKVANMMVAADPVGQENDAWLTKLVNDPKYAIVIGAWGNNGSFLKRGNTVRQIVSDLHCLVKNKSGEPRHPLYVRSETQPILL